MQLLFFAILEDLKPVIDEVESSRPVKYVA